MPGKDPAPTTHLHWPAAFHRAADYDGDVARIAQAWERHFASADPDAAQILFDFYAPTALIEAVLAKKRNPKLFREPTEDLMADAAIGLWKAIGKAKPGFHVHGFWHIARRAARKSISREVLKRAGTNHRQVEKSNIIADHRARFVQNEGRLPERHELAELLAGEFTNPNIALDYRRNVVPVSHSDYPHQAEKEMYEAVDRGPSPEDRVLDREVVGLACKSLDPRDRLILKSLLAGLSPAEIAAKIGQSEYITRRRMNGLLWETRCRADLAKYLGVEPETRGPQCRYVAATPSGRIVASRKGPNPSMPPQAAALGLSELPTQPLKRDARSDAEIIALLRAGYSQRSLIVATPGKTTSVKARISGLQHALLLEIKQSMPATMAG